MRNNIRAIARFIVAVFFGVIAYSVVNPLNLDPLMWYSNAPFADSIIGHLFLYALVASIGCVVTALVYAFILKPQDEGDGECRCRKCGYILRGLSKPECSECGEVI
jgi:hypothetical protein